MIEPSGRRQFMTTHWSLVGAAKGGEVSQRRARKALEELCRVYPDRSDSTSAERL